MHFYAEKNTIRTIAHKHVEPLLVPGILVHYVLRDDVMGFYAMVVLAVCEVLL